MTCSGRFLPHALQHHGVLPQACAERRIPTYCVEKVGAGRNHEKVLTKCLSHAKSETVGVGKTKTTRVRRATFSAPGLFQHNRPAAVIEARMFQRPLLVKRVFHGI